MSVSIFEFSHQNWLTCLCEMNDSSEAVLSSDTYSEIVAKMSSVQLAAPAYFIISGTTEKEGIILSRDRLAKSDRVPPLSLGQRTPGWYLLVI